MATGGRKTQETYSTIIIIHPRYSGMIVLPLTIRFPVPFVLPPDGFNFFLDVVHYNIQLTNVGHRVTVKRASSPPSYIVVRCLPCAAIMFSQIIIVVVRPSHVIFFMHFYRLRAAGRIPRRHWYGNRRSKILYLPLQLCTT